MQWRWLISTRIPGRLKEKHILFAALILLGLVVYYSIFEYGVSSETAVEYLGAPILLLDYRAVKKIQVKTHDGKEFIAERREMSWDLVKERSLENMQACLVNMAWKIPPMK